MNIKNITPGTLIRSALVIIVFAFLILKDYGVIPVPVDTSQVVDQMTTAAATVTALIAAWKNNSFTEAAQRADEYMEKLKNE